jgi:hypothetical protein
LKLTLKIYFSKKISVTPARHEIEISKKAKLKAKFNPYIKAILGT